MTKSSRLKVSLSLPADLVATLDRRARDTPGATRSAVAEEYLRRGARVKAESDLREEVTAYYNSLTAEERLENENMARGSSRAARQLEIRDSMSKPSWKPKR